MATGMPPTQAWYGPINLYPAWDLTPNAWLPWSGVYVTLAPWELGWAFLLPVNLLVTSVITWVIVYVIFPFVYMGPYTPATMGSANSAIRLVGFLWRHDDLGFSLPSIVLGMLWAAVFAPILLNWRQMAPIFKALFKEPPREFDPDRPISYRLTWLLTIGFFILWYIVGVALVQIKPDALIACMVMLAITFFGVGRVLSETGGWYGAFHLNPYYTHEAVVWGFSANVATKLGDDIPSYVTAFTMGERGHQFSFGDRVPFFSLHSFKLGDNTRTRLKGLVLIMIIGIILGVTLMAYVHFFNRAFSTYLWKYRGEYIRKAVKSAKKGVSHRGDEFWLQTPNETIIQIVFGFALIFALTFLQARIAPLRQISIGGIIWGFNAMYLMWVPYIVGFIVKYIVLRTGGTRMYQQTLKPFGLGLLVGGLLTLSVADLGVWLAWLIHGVRMGAPF